MASLAAVTAAAGLLALGGWFDAVEGSGKAKEEVREVGPFHGVAVGGSVEAVVKPGKRHKVTLIADDNLLPHIRTVVEKGILHTRYENLDPEVGIRLLVEAPYVDDLDASGGVDASGGASVVTNYGRPTPK